MSKKALLGESRVRRFMELAGNESHTNRFINENLEEEAPLEEEAYEEDLSLEEEDLSLFEEEPPMDDEAPVEEEPPVDLGAGEADPEADAEADEDVDVTVDEEQVAALRTAVEVLQNIIDASGGEEEPGEEAPEDEMGAMDPGMDMAPPEGGEEVAADEPPAPEEDELMAESVEALTKKVLERVTKRLVQQAIQK